MSADFGYQLLMLDGPSTSAEDLVVWSAVPCAAAYIAKLTLVFQKRYPMRNDHPES